MGDFSWDKMSPEQIQTAKSIKSAALEQGVDPKYALAIGYMESSFNPKAKAQGSSAQGPMQLIEGTAKDLGVDPSNPEDNIKGGVKYIRQNMDKYKDPYVAAIAYKAGPGVADEFLKTKDLSKLDKETISYLKKLKGHLGASQPKQEADVKPKQEAPAPVPAQPTDTAPSDASKFKLSSEAQDLYKSAKEWATKPTEQQDFSLGRVAASTAIGAGAGSLIPGVGTVGGGVAGLASGVSGEFSRMAGAPEGVTFALEMGGGALPGVAGKLAKTAAGKVMLPYSAKSLASYLPESSGDIRAALLAKQKMFGADTFNGMARTESSDAVQAAEKEALSKAGYVVGHGQKASDGLRNNIYSDMMDLNKQGASFGRSNEFNTVSANLDALATKYPNSISKTQVKEIKNVLRGQSMESPSEIINLIQKMGGKAGTPEDQLAKTVKGGFNDYLKTATGKGSYELLKNVEEKEFVAAARDSIPTLLNKGFKPGALEGGKKEYVQALKNINKSPEGKAEFVKAINQHFANYGKDPVTGQIAEKGLNPERLIKEVERLSPAITRSGVMSEAQFGAIKDVIKNLPKTLSAEKRAQLGKTILLKSLAGAGSATSAKAVSDVNPLGVFSE